ncbi:MAG: DUF6600 domain-containing protein [Syntrophobacteraceae bacterium]
MKYVKNILLLTVVALCAAAQAAWSAPQAPDRPRRHTQSKEEVLVGRISLVEGEVLRYVHEEKDWVVTVKDSPFGREDAVYSGENGKAEFLMPNSTWIRIGADTQIQMIALKDDTTEVDVAEGVTRFINRSPGAVIKATTPFGYAVGAPGSVFDLYVGDESVETIAIACKVDFVHDLDGAKYHVIPGSLSILADNRQAASGEGKVDAEWDDWNISRDSILVHGIETKGESVNHLPEGIREDSQVFDQNGRWENVYYEGRYREAWRPTSVEEGWSPYTVGHWTDWDGDYTWVPYEPFGYVTHHYGYWFRANDCWYWAPPAVPVDWGFPRWGIGFGWYPGRVGWFYSDVGVGWFPLLPWEPFYASNWWGPWGFAVYHAGLISVNFRRFRNWDRAVIVNQRDFHNVKSYGATRLTNVNSRTIASAYKASPVVSNNVLKNAGDPGQRFNYTNAAPHSKPAQNVTSRVAQNQVKFKSNSAAVNSSAIRNQLSGAKLAKPSAWAHVPAPKIASAKNGAVRPQALIRNPRAVKPSPAVAKSAQGRGTAQNRSLRQRNQRPASKSASSGRQGTRHAERGVRSHRGGPMGGRPSGLQRSPGRMRGPGGSAPGRGGGRGGGGHAGSMHR